MADIKATYTHHTFTLCYREAVSIGGAQICRTALVFFKRVSATWGVCVFARYCDRVEKSTPGKGSSRKGKGPKCQNSLLLLPQIFLGISVSSVNDDWHDLVAKFYFSGQGDMVNPDAVILHLVILPSSYQPGSQSISRSISIFVESGLRLQVWHCHKDLF